MSSAYNMVGYWNINIRRIIIRVNKKFTLTFLASLSNADRHGTHHFPICVKRLKSCAWPKSIGKLHPRISHFCVRVLSCVLSRAVHRPHTNGLLTAIIAPLERYLLSLSLSAATLQIGNVLLDKSCLQATVMMLPDIMLDSS